MRKNPMIFGLALALAACSAGAQDTTRQQGDKRPGQHQDDRRGPGGERGFGRRGGPEGFLLRGITLTDAQKQQLQQLRDRDRAEMEKSRDANRDRMEQARAARQRGDTAAARRSFEQMRAQMDARRDQHAAQIRSILTADQRKTFDANLAEAKKREAERGPGHRGFDGPRGGHGRRGPGGERGDRDDDQGPPPPPPAR